MDFISLWIQSHAYWNEAERRKSDYADIVSMPCLLARIIFTYEAKYPSRRPLELVPSLSLVCSNHPIESRQSIQFLTFSLPDQKLLFNSRSFLLKNIDFMERKELFLGESSFCVSGTARKCLIVPPWWSVTSQNHHWVE